jgi:ABC-type taurine transport system substrate-binding protein
MTDFAKGFPMPTVPDEIGDADKWLKRQQAIKRLVKLTGINKKNQPLALTLAEEIKEEV